jgi:two-component system, LuxR family, response regulator FixJ
VEGGIALSGTGAVVYIVEDDPSFRKSTERLIRAAGFETLAFGSAKDFLEQSALRRPACLLLDVMLPDMDGLDLQRRLMEKGCPMPIIFMTGHGSIPMSVEAMKKGAVDFLPKPFDAGALRQAIARAVEQDFAGLVKESRADRIRLLLDTLTPRELEVLRWVISGRLNKQIALALGTTEKTIKVHRGRMIHKMGVSSVADLVRLAESAGILPAE